MTKQLITPEMKLLALQYVEEELYSIREICEKYAISTYTFKSWRTKFKTGGIEALTPAKKNKFYSKELKERAVADYLTKKYSMYEILSTYEISSWSLFKSWLKTYTSHSELKDSGKGMSQTMTKGRKTTVVERIEIVKACLANAKNYQETAAQYEVSYQQVYQWVRKFEQDGEKALQDLLLEESYFYFVDRIKDMIKRSGENVAARSEEHRLVYEATVIMKRIR